MEVYNLSQNISPTVPGNITSVTSLMTPVNVLSDVARSVKKHTSMCSTLYNLKALFPPTWANGSPISSTGSFLPVASGLSHWLRRWWGNCFLVGEGWDFIETLSSSHTEIRGSDPAASERVLRSRSPFSYRPGQAGTTQATATHLGQMLAGSSLRKWQNAAPLARRYPQFLPRPLPQSRGLRQERFSSANNCLLLWGPRCTPHGVWDCLLSNVQCSCGFWLVLQRAVSASPRNSGLVSAEARRPRQARAGRAWGRRCRTFSVRAWRQRPHSCGWWVTLHYRSCLHSKTDTPVMKARGEGKEWVMGSRGKGEAKSHKSKLLQCWD